MEALPPYLTGIVAILLLSAFVKILTTLSILRFGLGLTGAGFGFVVIGVSFALALLVMTPQLESMGGLNKAIELETEQVDLELQVRFGDFLEKHAHPQIRTKFNGVAKRLGATGEEESFMVLAAAFLISELKEAFQLGVIILIPFVLIDLLVTNVLMALGTFQMPHSVVAIPLKILLFFAVDGWVLVSEKLIAGYA